MADNISTVMTAADISRHPLPSDNGLYLWLIVGFGLGGGLLLTVLVAVLIYMRRRRRKKGDLLESSYVPGAEFCPQQMISSFSSTASEDGGSDAMSPVGRQFRRPLGPSTSLDPPSLLRLTSECVQPRPALTRWHTVAAPPHCPPVHATLDLDRDSDDEDGHNPPCLHGRVWFSLLYEKEHNRMQVTLLKAKYLPGRGLVNAPRDPFVKVFLLPDEENFRQSKMRKRTLAPKFNETFEFNVNSDGVLKRTLKLSVYDVDKRKVRHCLGHVIYPLASDDTPLSGEVIWKDLEIASQPATSLGEIQICLSCNPYSNRIKATVCKLRNLQGISAEDALLYVKVQLYHGRKMIKSKRTVPITPSADLSLDETFSFAVSGRFFDSCSLTFTAVFAGPSPLVKDRSHGRVVIGPFMYARGEALQHWQEMLSNPRNMVMRWHGLEAIKK